jgi:hypothetical protein
MNFSRPQTRQQGAADIIEANAAVDTADCADTANAADRGVTALKLDGDIVTISLVVSTPDTADSADTANYAELPRVNDTRDTADSADTNPEWSR